MDILKEASRIISGPRRKAYGPVEESFKRIALIWSGVLGLTITDKQVAKMMIGLKLYRESSAHSDDNLIDLIGYTLLLDKLEKNETKKPV